jgi:hypothetical protein
MEYLNKVTGYGLDDQGLILGRNTALPRTDSGAHLSSYPVDIRGPFLQG